MSYSKNAGGLFLLANIVVFGLDSLNSTKCAGGLVFISENSRFWVRFVTIDSGDYKFPFFYNPNYENVV